jgi:hypothetical protein
LLLLPSLAACGGSSGGGSTTGGATSTAAGGGASQTAAAGQGKTFVKSAPDQSFCDIFTEQDYATLKMVTKGRPQAGQGQTSVDQPLQPHCNWTYGSWGYNDVVSITTYPSADEAKKAMSIRPHGITAKDVVTGADESDYRFGAGDEMKAIVNARHGNFIFVVSLNDTVAKLSPEDAKSAALGMATIMLQRCPNVK